MSNIVKIGLCLTCDIVEKEEGDLAPLVLNLADTEATESLSPRSDMVSDSRSISMLSSGCRNKASLLNVLGSELLLE